jgi:hypothetical protein
MITLSLAAARLQSQTPTRLCLNALATCRCDKNAFCAEIEAHLRRHGGDEGVDKLKHGEVMRR